MAEEYKNFNEYEKAPETEENPFFASETEAAGEEAPSPDPNPPTGWAPGFSEKNEGSMSTSSFSGITSIILSAAGFCSVLAPILGLIVGVSAYRRNKLDVTAKVGFIACILMLIFWAGTLAFYLFTPTGQAMFAEIMEETQRTMNEILSSSDIYSFFR